MEEVRCIIRGLTNVWASDHTLSRIREDLDEEEQCALALKMDGCANVGFWNVSDRIVRHEGSEGGGETWRFGYKNSTLFRVVGFFETDQKRDFIALDAFYKPVRGYSKAQWKRMKQISEIKRQGDKAWQRKDE